MAEDDAVAAPEAATHPAEPSPLHSEAAVPEELTHPEEPSSHPLEVSAPIYPDTNPGGGVLTAVALIVACIALLLAGATVAAPSMVGWLRTTLGVGQPGLADATTFRTLEGEIRGATTRIDVIEATGNGNRAAAKRIDDLETQAAALSERLRAEESVSHTLQGQLDRLEQRDAELGGDLKKAGERLAATETLLKSANVPVSPAAARSAANPTSVASAAEAGRRPERLFLLAIELRNAARTRGSFAKQLAAVRLFTAEAPELQPALKTLAAYAQSGTPTVEDLRRNFSTVLAPRVAALSPAVREPLPQRIVAWADSVLSPRPERTRNDRNAVMIALAERSLGEGQLSAAVDQVLQLEDEAALLAAEWLQGASARLAADAATGAIVGQAFDRLAAP